MINLFVQVPFLRISSSSALLLHGTKCVSIVDRPMRIDPNHCRPGNRKSTIERRPPNDLDGIFLKRTIRLINENVKLPDWLQMSEDMAMKSFGADTILQWNVSGICMQYA